MRGTTTNWATSLLVALACSIAVWELFSRNFLFYDAERRVFPDGSQYAVGWNVRWKEGYSRLTFSDEGYRLPLPPKGRKHNVLVMGDSFTQAAQVSDEETFVMQTQRNLDEQGGDAAVWNAGSSGLSPSAYIGVAPQYREMLNPDTTVIQLNTLDFREDRIDKSRVYWVEDTGDDFKLQKNKDNATGALGPKKLQKIPGFVPAFGLLRKSSLFQTVLANASKGPEAPKGKQVKKGVKVSDEQVVARYVRWAVTEMNKAYPGLVLVYVPTIDYYDLTAKPPSDEPGLERVCQEMGVPLINLRSSYIDHYRRTGEVPHGFSNTTPGAGHINALGHRILGAELAAKLRQVWGA